MNEIVKTLGTFHKMSLEANLSFVLIWMLLQNSHLSLVLHDKWNDAAIYCLYITSVIILHCFISQPLFISIIIEYVLKLESCSYCCKYAICTFKTTFPLYKVKMSNQLWTLNYLLSFIVICQPYLIYFINTQQLQNTLRPISNPIFLIIFDALVNKH